MIECKTLEEAQKVEGVIHIVAGSPVLAYQVGDILPDHCLSDAEKGIVVAEQPSEIDQLLARIAALEAK